MSSEAVNKLAPPEEVFYRRLMSVVDDFGRFDGRPQVLRGRLYPLRIDSVREADITRWIAACVKAGLIALYHVDGKPYLLLGKLGPPRAKDSKFPAPPPEIDRSQLADASTCAQMKSDEIICAHVKANVPYSNSGSDTDTSSNTESDSKDSPEPPPAASVPVALVPTETALIIFPTVGTGGKEWNLLPSQVTAWKPAFPAIDVLAQCQLALQWCDANPSKRKTANGMKAFLVRWLTKAQNEAGRNGQAQRPLFSKQSAAEDYDARQMLDAYGGQR